MLILKNSFFRRNYCHLRNKAIPISFSFYFCPTSCFEMGRKSCQESLERYEEQIEEILNQLDKLSLDRIEHIEDKIEGLGKECLPKGRQHLKNSRMTRIAIRKLVANSVTTALEAQAANMANTDNTTRPKEAPMARQCSYKEFMSCQPINFKGLGRA
ncbi:hypothetical protein Tco_0893167 [Tanacetum coccineum]|uniref:Uncharacterized protein n=1 Tax=Tanacetum coccineum TaxID=301880 RepID=A0ABQ5C811_9ASTR